MGLFLDHFRLINRIRASILDTRANLEEHLIHIATSSGLSEAEAVGKLGDGTLLQWIVDNADKIGVAIVTLAKAIAAALAAFKTA